MTLPKRVRINEEGPREGFQIEKGPIPTARKIELINRLAETGLQQIQVASFVNPKLVPGMADAGEVVAGLTPVAGVDYTGLWLNQQGLQRALGHADKLTIRGTFSLCASEAFSIRNTGRDLKQNLEAQVPIIETYKQHGIPVTRASIQAAFGCNFQGEVPLQAVLGMAAQIMELNQKYDLAVSEICLADTMAWATPLKVKQTVGALREAYPDARFSLHLHDTRGMAIANAYAGLELGIDIFDAAVAGLGGCPFAAHKGAAGNICTEDLVFMCHELGIETGIDLDRLIEAALLAEEIVGHPLPGSVKLGGPLPAAKTGIRA